MLSEFLVFQLLFLKKKLLSSVLVNTAAINQHQGKNDKITRDISFSDRKNKSHAWVDLNPELTSAITAVR